MICNKINDSGENIKSNHHRVWEKGKVLCRFTQKSHLQYYSYLEHTSLLVPLSNSCQSAFQISVGNIRTNQQYKTSSTF